MDVLRSPEKDRNQLCGDCCTKKDKYNMYYFVIKFVVVAILLFPGTSEAYLDPGTGSFVFQMLIAGALGGLYAIKTFWGNIKSFFNKNNKK